MITKLPWLALKAVPGVGLVLFQRLLERFGSPAAVFGATAAALAAVRGVSPETARAILAFRDWDKIEAQLDGLAKLGVEVITQAEAGFPGRLQQIPYPPPYLFVKGSLTPAADLAVGIVGTRAASYYGAKTSRRLAKDLGGRNVTVVSGLARGIDTAAHQGALEAGGRTLAVLGCGVDVVYPPENRALYEQIPEHGALVSEYPPGTPPEGRNFPVRNRIISGLSLAVVVVECRYPKSGAQITVRYALDQGRDVLAVPGPIDSPVSQGPHRLIQQGAKLVHTVDDILEELPGGEGLAAAAPWGRPERPGGEEPLLALLGSTPLSLEELVQTSQLPAPAVLSRLTLLELQGLIRELPGKCYVLEG